MIFNLEDIPKEVIAEIEREYTIIFDRYGETEVQFDFRTKRLEFTQAGAEEVTVDMIDPLTFKSKKVTGIPHQMFAARGIWNEEEKTVILISVLFAGSVMRVPT